MREPKNEPRDSTKGESEKMIDFFSRYFCDTEKYQKQVIFMQALERALDGKELPEDFSIEEQKEDFKFHFEDEEDEEDENVQKESLLVLANPDGSTTEIIIDEESLENEKDELKNYAKQIEQWKKLEPFLRKGTIEELQILKSLFKLISKINT